MHTSELDLAPWPALAASHVYSLELLQFAERALAARASRFAAIEAVLVCGSLGRLEASESSDIDCIVVARHKSDLPLAAEAAAINDGLSTLQLRPAKARGIYREPVTVAALTDIAALGSLSEPPEIFGKRIQCLLDARPIFGASRFSTLQREILEWYGTGFFAANPSRGWTYLINDLTRYLHAYAAWQQYKTERTADDSWWLRQSKLRTTRVVTVAGMLLLLGESSLRVDKLAWLNHRLRLTPLERVCDVMARYDGAALARFMDAYNAAHALAADPGHRRHLIEGGPASIAELPGEPDPLYARVNESSAAIMSILTTFLLDRRCDWDARFFERLLL